MIAINSHSVGSKYKAMLYAYATNAEGLAAAVLRADSLAGLSPALAVTVEIDGKPVADTTRARLIKLVEDNKIDDFDALIERTLREHRGG